MTHRCLQTLGACSMLLASCATTVTPSTRSPQPGSVDLQGSLSLVDGTPVPGATLQLRCGTLEASIITDEGGRFTVPGVPEGRCSVKSAAAGLDRAVRVSRGLPSAGARLDLRLAAVHRLGLSWSEGARTGAFSLDETVPHSNQAGGHAVRLADEQLLVDGQRLAALGGLARGQRFAVGKLQLTVSSVERRAFMPIAFRRAAPAAVAWGKLPLFSGDGQQATPPLGARTLVMAGGCEQLRPELLEELEALAVTHDAAGLRTFSILTGECARTARPSQSLLGGPEALWALGTRPGEVAILDGDGRTIRRLASLEEAQSHLRRSFPPFAAASKVSVTPSATVVEAETDRLLAQARAKQKEGKHGEAHRLLDQVLRLSPDLAEARKERALIKAKLGDLTGALTEVTWWRSSFGADSADDLLEEVERTARLSTLR